ncbi:MAG: ATP-binding protein [Gammaproteobacteria bacterium]|nr:ATP-binding protein [Gammaproteobacteria bacterium]
MDFLDREEELLRLDASLAQPRPFAAIWGRRRVGKSRLLIEWSRRCGGLYTMADPSAPAVQRRYLAETVARRFPRFADVEYPDWRSFLDRLADEARATGWRGPFIIDELPYLVQADASVPGALQNWLDGERPRPALAVSGSSQQMMYGAVLAADAPLYGRASEAFALRPLRPGYLGEAMDLADARSQVVAYALWGGLPRYWELAAPFGTGFDRAVDPLVLDTPGALHEGPPRLLLEETPPATVLRPLLDVIGAGAHRVSEMAGRLGRPASSLSRSLATLVAMDFVRREIPFGSDPRSDKRSLYRLADPFLRLWFRVVAPHRAALAEARRETRLAYWQRQRAALEAYAWEELCRMAVPFLHRADHPLAPLGPFEPARRYWRGRAPEVDVVARSVDGRHVLVGEAKWRAGPLSAAEADAWLARLRAATRVLPGIEGCRVVYAFFVPHGGGRVRHADMHVVDAGTVMGVLR